MIDQCRLESFLAVNLFISQISDFKGLGSVFCWTELEPDQQSFVCTIDGTSCQKLLQTISAETLGQQKQHNFDYADFS